MNKNSRPNSSREGLPVGWQISIGPPDTFTGGICWASKTGKCRWILAFHIRLSRQFPSLPKRRRRRQPISFHESEVSRSHNTLYTLVLTMSWMKGLWDLGPKSGGKNWDLAAWHNLWCNIHLCFCPDTLKRKMKLRPASSFLFSESLRWMLNCQQDGHFHHRLGQNVHSWS